VRGQINQTIPMLHVVFSVLTSVQPDRLTLQSRISRCLTTVTSFLKHCDHSLHVVHDITGEVTRVGVVVGDVNVDIGVVTFIVIGLDCTDESSEMSYAL